MSLQVLKRNGNVEEFDYDKLARSVMLAFAEAERVLGRSVGDWKSVVDSVASTLNGKDSVSTWELNDMVERELIERSVDDPAYEFVAKVFFLKRIEKDVGKHVDVESFNGLTYNAVRLFASRYMYRDPETGRFRETPLDVFNRVARHVARSDEVAATVFYEVMSDRVFVPNSPTLMNAGLRLGQLSACFVLPVHDSMVSIFDSLKNMALIHQSGGGTGFNFSELRPAGDVVASTSGVASGPVSFMRIYDVATDVVKQGGKRRGANMGILEVWHPDIELFIKSKSGELKDKTLQNFNISVGVWDSFMEAVLEDADYGLVNPRSGEVVRTVKAKKLFEQIVESAWESGDPGVIFLSEVNRRNPMLDALGPIRATNPCVSGDTMILTPRGWVKAKDLYDEAKKQGDVRGVLVSESELGEGGSKVSYRTVLSLPLGYGGELWRVNAWVWHVGKKPGLKIYTDNGLSITVTFEHKFYVGNGEWIEAKDLSEGAVLIVGQLDESSKRFEIKTAKVVKVEHVEEVDFYDFTVPGYHMYIANGFVNHNCGEVPLYPFESCNLGSINLEKFVDESGVKWRELGRAVRVAVNFLDSVIDVNKFPLAEIREMNKRLRRVGLGVMGWAHMLMMLGVPYDSDDALFLAENVAEWILYNAVLASVDLAAKRGAFPLFKDSAWSKGVLPVDTAPDPVFDSGTVTSRVKGIVSRRPKVDWEHVRDRVLEDGVRNVALLSIAPTGSISIVAGASPSIEPVFALAFTRNVTVGELLEVDRVFMGHLRERGDSDLARLVAETGSIQHLSVFSDEEKRVYKTALDIAPEWHVKMQAAWQRFVDNAVSKTVNMPSTATVEDVKNVYLLAWRLGCKGITVYRDRSKSTQVINFGFKAKKSTVKLDSDDAGDCPTCNV